MSTDSNSPSAVAQAYTSNPRFHQHFTLEATDTHDTLNVTYAEVGQEPDEINSTPTVLLIPGMFASRYLGLPLHAIAAKKGVRMVVVDRPGMGGSTDVPLAQRVAVWVELVPRLLAHLGIQRVALVSHSAGTIYLLNTLAYCRDVLYPDRLAVAFLSPWVDPAFSRVTSMQMAQYVPAKAFSLWDRIPRFMLLQAGPAFASSGAVVKKVTNAISSTGTCTDDNSEQEKRRRLLEESYGVPRDVQVEIESAMIRLMFQESTVGSNSEALQCLRKADSNTWGICDDYKAFVREFARLQRGREGPPLKIQAYFAGSDVMIGQKGQEYFEACWRGTGDGEFQGAIEFASTTVPGTDHDTLPLSVETWERIFADVSSVADHTPEQ